MNLKNKKITLKKNKKYSSFNNKLESLKKKKMRLCLNLKHSNVFVTLTDSSGKVLSSQHAGTLIFLVIKD